jgi:urease accessory protein
MGRSMLEWLRGQAPPDTTVDGTAAAALATLAALRPAPTWPIAFALAAVRAQAPDREAVLAYGFSWAENQVQAALKAVPLGQSAGQRILARLARELPSLVEAALVLPEEAWQAFTPLLAMRSARHETQYSRLFRS